MDFLFKTNDSSFSPSLNIFIQYNKMPCQLSADCLDKIFKYLEKDKVALCSCLLVNNLWCEVFVQILWTNIQNYNTLIACLPHESKELLHENEIIISTPTSKPTLFNYVAFIKNLSMSKIFYNLRNLLHQPISSERFDKVILIIQKIFKMVMNQISLKRLEFHNSRSFSDDIPFTIYPGAIDCLRNLSELKCDAFICSGFLSQISKICHNLQSLELYIQDTSDELANLISIQQDLKYLSIIDYSDDGKLTKIIPSITKHADHLIKLHITLTETNISTHCRLLPNSQIYENFY